MATINPKWIEYNRSVNEGGEGYNPHQKYIASAASPAGVRKMIAGKARSYDEAVKFARNCLSGAQKESFMSQVAAAFPGRV
jgi:ABC-type protease/lipase transport system fused ATPase/permease subunit